MPSPLQTPDDIAETVVSHMHLVARVAIQKYRVDRGCDYCHWSHHFHIFHALLLWWCLQPGTVICDVSRLEVIVMTRTVAMGVYLQHRFDSLFRKCGDSNSELHGLFSLGFK